MHGTVRLLLGLALLLSLTACTTNRPVALSLDPNPAAQSEASSATVASSTTDATAAVGKEQTILSAVPAALESAAKATADQGTKIPDLSQATPKIVAYIFVARTGKLDYLFEVRDDGRAYELYAYPTKPDPAKLMGGELPADEAALLQPPSGTREIAAAAAVKAIMEKSPAGRAQVFIYGYNLGFVDKSGAPVTSPGGQPFQISVDPNGKLVEI